MNRPYLFRHSCRWATAITSGIWEISIAMSKPISSQIPILARSSKSASDWPGELIDKLDSPRIPLELDCKQIPSNGNNAVDTVCSRTIVCWEMVHSIVRRWVPMLVFPREAIMIEISTNWNVNFAVKNVSASLVSAIVHPVTTITNTNACSPSPRWFRHATPFVRNWVLDQCDPRSKSVHVLGNKPRMNRTSNSSRRQSTRWFLCHWWTVIQRRNIPRRNKCGTMSSGTIEDISRRSVLLWLFSHLSFTWDSQIRSHTHASPDLIERRETRSSKVSLDKNTTGSLFFFVGYVTQRQIANQCVPSDRQRLNETCVSLLSSWKNELENKHRSLVLAHG